MPENDKTGTEEENFSLHCVQDGQKDGKKKRKRSRKLLLGAAKGSEAPGVKHSFV